MASKATNQVEKLKSKTSITDNTWSIRTIDWQSKLRIKEKSPKFTSENWSEDELRLRVKQ
jgi:hypothetical protein